MKETRFVTFSFGEAGVPRGRELLLKLGLSAVAEFETEGPLAGYGSVTLEVADPRLELLLEELRNAGQDPHPRADRVYSNKELDAFPWLTMTASTAGLAGGVTFGQPYDLSHACPTCGAGATPILPLIADLSRMGKKQIDATAHEDFLVVTRTLASAIAGAGLTGVDFQPVRRPSHEEPDSNYFWMKTDFEWPPMEPDSVLDIEDRCPTCLRSGHFDSYQRVTELHFRSAPELATDFGTTWEYFGVWKSARVKRAPVGGSRKVIVSRAARQFLVAQKVRRIRFDPVWIHEHLAP